MESVSEYILQPTRKKKDTSTVASPRTRVDRKTSSLKILPVQLPMRAYEINTNSIYFEKKPSRARNDALSSLRKKHVDNRGWLQPRGYQPTRPYYISCLPTFYIKKYSRTFTCFFISHTRGRVCCFMSVLILRISRIRFDYILLPSRR